MYPSGRWDGFWQQTGFGRQPMTAFELQFRGGKVTGRGSDIIGPFTIVGQFDRTIGQVSFRKLYTGRHSVDFHGKPDGEGCILGTWQIGGDYSKYEGPFLIRPVVEQSTDLDGIREIRPRQLA